MINCYRHYVGIAIRSPQEICTLSYFIINDDNKTILIIYFLWHHIFNKFFFLFGLCSIRTGFSLSFVLSSKSSMCVFKVMQCLKMYFLIVDSTRRDIGANIVCKSMKKKCRNSLYFSAVTCFFNFIFISNIKLMTEFHNLVMNYRLTSFLSFKDP